MGMILKLKMNILIRMKLIEFILENVSNNKILVYYLTIHFYILFFDIKIQ